MVRPKPCAHNKIPQRQISNIRTNRVWSIVESMQSDRTLAMWEWMLGGNKLIPRVWCGTALSLSGPERLLQTWAVSEKVTLYRV